MGLIKHFLNNTILGVKTEGGTPYIPEGVIARIEVLEDNLYEYELFQLITSGTSGTITPPSHCTILLDQYQEAADCLITQIDSNYRPIDKPVYSVSGGIVKSSLNAAGAYVLTGTPSSYPVALIYQVSVQGKYIDNIPLASLADQYQVITESSSGIPESILLYRDLNGNIDHITYSTKPTLYITRDGLGTILSYTNNIYTWTINRVDNVITGITVTEN